MINCWMCEFIWRQISFVVITSDKVAMFQILFPVLGYISRSSPTLPYPEIASGSNCSSNTVSFGHDCTDTEERTHSVVGVETLPPDEAVLVDSVDIQDLSRSRMGRSGWAQESSSFLVETTTSILEFGGNTDVEPQSENILATPQGTTSHDVLTFNENTTFPPYAITPISKFTDAYPQINYKTPHSNVNIYHVMKYLQEKGSAVKQRASKKSDSIPETDTMMKVVGTYMMPLDMRPGEIVMSKSGNASDENYINGHAYVSDPFLKFRPDNVLEINRLVPTRSEIDLGPRFKKPIPFVPKVSPTEDPITTLRNGHRGSRDHDSQTGATFHGPETYPPLILRPPPPPGPRDKPISVTLDIYPVTMDAESGI